MHMAASRRRRRRHHRRPHPTITPPRTGLPPATIRTAPPSPNLNPSNAAQIASEADYITRCILLRKDQHGNPLLPQPGRPRRPLINHNTGNSTIRRIRHIRPTNPAKRPNRPANGG